MIKKIVFLFLFFSNLSFSQVSIPFVWGNDSLNGEYFEKTSMHIPVHFPNDSLTYYFQFDTGSNQSFLYNGNYLSKFINDTLHSDIGKINLERINSNSQYFEDGRLHVGTIGTDFLENKKIEIDFVNQQITMVTKYDSSSYSIAPMKLNFGRPSLTLDINGKFHDFLFDTGSSLFEIWTSKKIWNKLKNEDTEVKEYPISSWGKINIAYRTTIHSNVNLPFYNLIHFEEVWYNSNKKFEKDFRSINVSGIIGNKAFIKTIILLDFENKIFGIKSYR